MSSVREPTNFNLSAWSDLDALMKDEIDVSKDEIWSTFVAQFMRALSQLFKVDRLLIQICLEKDEGSLNNEQLARYFSIYDLVERSSRGTVEEALYSLKSKPNEINPRIVLGVLESEDVMAIEMHESPSREFFISEFRASYLPVEVSMINHVVLKNENIAEETKFDVAKEATDSVKGFVERLLKGVKKVKSGLSTFNEILGIGRKLFRI